MLVYCGENLVGDIWYLDIEVTSKGILVSKVNIDRNSNVQREFDYVYDFPNVEEILDFVAEETLSVRALLDVHKYLKEHGLIDFDLTTEEAIEWIKDAILDVVADVENEEEARKIAKSTL